MSTIWRAWIGLLPLFAVLMGIAGPASAQQKPNILFIMGDDIGWFNAMVLFASPMSSSAFNSAPTLSSSSPPTTAPRRLRGPTVA
jgi:hypothetical protein